MTIIRNWKENVITLKQGQTYVYNLTTQSNIVQITNKKAVGGGAVYLDTTPSVTPDQYSQKVQQGKQGTFVKPYPLKTLYLATDGGTVTITITEVESSELVFAFNSGQLIDIQGQVQVDEPVTIDGTVQVAGEVEIKNDQGNPIPIDGLKLSDIKVMADGTLYVNDVDARSKLDQLITLMETNNQLLRDLITTNGGTPSV